MKAGHDELRQRQLLRLAGVRTRKALIGPREVMLHVTSRCNLSCWFCFYHAPASPHRKALPQTMPLDRFESIIDDCARLGVDRVIFSGEGEPTLHPHFYSMLHYLDGRALAVSLFSNGTFPRKRCWDIVHVDQIVINLGALHPAQYRNVHGKDYFKRVAGNIACLADLRKAHNPQLRIDVTYLLNKLNAAAQSKISLFMRSLGVDAVRIAEADTFEHNRDIHLPHARPHQRRVPVPCGWYGASVRLDGKVSACCYLPQAVVADLAACSFAQAWKGASFARMRTAVLEGAYWDAEDGCRHCPELKRYQPGMRVVSGGKGCVA